MQQATNERPSRIPWPPILLASIVAASAVAERYVLPQGLLPVTAGVFALGLVLCAAAAGLLAWTLLELRRHGTTVRPDRAATALAEGGPFRFSRNPIYLADAVLLAGLGLIAGWVSLVAGAFAFIALVTPLAVLPEEAHLERRFGDAYRAYRARVRRWL